jgi:pimeloyl-ACP methyl ester carboxylesterase
LALVLALTVSAVVATSPATATDPPPTLAAACSSTSGLTARSSWLLTDDKVRLYAIEAGRGPSVVILAHQGGANLCGWLPYAKTLVAAGYRVLAFDFRGWGHSDGPVTRSLDFRRDFAAAVAHARAGGARRVFLMGASMGGAAVVQNTAGLEVSGRISLSGTRLWAGYGINDPKGQAQMRAPYLYVGSREDGNAPMAEALGIFRRVGAHDKRTAIYAGSWHGWSLVEYAPFAPRLRALILDWLRSRAH